jgi:uncharacterized Zn finger protein
MKRYRYHRPRRDSGNISSNSSNKSGWPPVSPPPIRREDGIRARSQRGDFAKSWWAARWIGALEKVVDARRLARGRTYARGGQVLALEEERGGVRAVVQGSRPAPYNVTIKLRPINRGQWRAVIDALAGRALFAAQLLAGEMPQEIDQVFAAAGCSLFPTTRGELETSCSCPDAANPCKHVAAAHYILGEQIDDDPFLLFRLRGRTEEQVLAALRTRRSNSRVAEEPADYTAANTAEAAPALDADLEHFWRSGGAAGASTAAPIPIAIKPPAAPLPLLKRLGQPAFLDENLEQVLGPAYRAMQQAALAAAFEEE